MSDIEGAIKLQEKNGEVNYLKAGYSATKIAEHIAKEMKMKIFKNIIEDHFLTFWLRSSIRIL